MFEDQFDPGQSLLVLSWPLHAEYTIDEDGTIKGKGYADGAYQPLEDPDLFLSFSRLGAQGQPSDASILRWVEKYGLLTRGDENQGVNQMPMTVYEFGNEVQCARELAALYIDIREGNSAAIRARFVGKGKYGKTQFHAANDVGEHFAEVQEGADFWRSLEPADHPNHLKAGAAAFENILESLIEDDVPFQKGVSLQILSDEITRTDEGPLQLHSWEPHEPYRPVLSWRCPDLRSAIYLQFALMVTGGQPWRKCANPNCRSPFPAKPSNKKFCKAGCRSTGRNYPH